MNDLEKVMKEFGHVPHDQFYSSCGYRAELLCKHCGAICAYDCTDGMITFSGRNIAKLGNERYCERLRNML